MQRRPVKSSQQQRPVSTLGFSETKLSPAEVAVEKISASHSIVALVDSNEASEKSDVLPKQVVIYFFNFPSLTIFCLF